MKAIKICGIFRKEDVLIVNKYKPDYIGFVFAKSPRQVTRQQAKELKALVDKDIKVIGVFVNEEITKIMDIVKDKSIDGIQLHGKEDARYIERLKQYTNVPIIKAMSLTSGSKIEADVTYYLLDAKQPGHGQCFDWSLITKMDKPFFLAGGIHVDNIKEAMNIDCFGIDVSSGVETNGVKDEEKIKAIIGGIRNGKR